MLPTKSQRKEEKTMCVEVKTGKEFAKDDFAEWLRNRNKMNASLAEKFCALLISCDEEETSIDPNEAFYLLNLLEDDENAIFSLSQHLEIDL